MPFKNLCLKTRSIKSQANEEKRKKEWRKDVLSSE
jgi:hypothetical protein